MGPKVTIDSATLMNKGLEVIEAYHLFNLKPDEIEVLVHPQSIVHGMVEFRDGSVIAHLGAHDMRIPIAHCLAYPDRIDGPAKRLDLAEIGSLTFEKPDLDRFPALGLAWQALRTGSGATTVLNAANEIAVAEFVDRQDRLHRHPGAGRGDAGRCGTAAASCASPVPSRMQLPLTIIRD